MYTAYAISIKIKIKAHGSKIKTIQKPQGLDLGDSIVGLSGDAIIYLEDEN